ncbi:MAG: AAA-associated domain-containing protein [Caldisericaceae bacterium]
MDDVSPLPYVEVGKLVGMLVYLEDLDGRGDIYAIASDMESEVDEIIPLIKVAEALGFASVTEGDLVLTDLGKELVLGDENKRKLMFKSAIKKLRIFRKIIDVLETVPDNSISRSKLLDILTSEMSEEEAEEHLKSIIELGRYAELIGYNPEDKEIYLDKLEE